MAAQILKLAALTCVLAALLSNGTAAQTGADRRDAPGDDVQRRRGGMGAPAEEMLERARIRYEEEIHEEMVERAEEAARIGDELLGSFKKNNSLTRDDLKRLERLEKLARKIRGAAGGSDDKEELHDPPGEIGGAVERLASLSTDLRTSVSKTSRLVISATVIERSNDMIELIRHIRNFKKP
jgi:hypothetical protein